MRLRLEISTAATEIPWRKVLAPGRGIAYDLLAQTAPHLGRQLHEEGWGPHDMVPFGYGAPIFRSAPRRKGTYAAGGPGFVEFGSPLPPIIEAWSTALHERDLIDWGGVALRIKDVHLIDPPSFLSGTAIMRTDTPVVMKASDPYRQGAAVWVMPAEQEFPAYFTNNLLRKAETLDLLPDVELETITWIGPKRSFAVGGGHKPGAAIEVKLSGSPQVLQALWSWGLGQANSAGFGWIGEAQ